MNGIVNLSGIHQTNYGQSVTRGQIRADGAVEVHSQDAVSLTARQPVETTLLVNGDPVKVARELGNVPPAHQEAGGVAQYLSGVDDRRFYNERGEPNYNGLLADLGRKSFATFPDSLEDGRLPNLSTFQRAVATEARQREQKLGTALFIEDPMATAANAIGIMLVRGEETDSRAYSGVATSQSPVQGQLALDPFTGAFEQVETSSGSRTSYTVTAQVTSNPERDFLSGIPTVREMSGGLSKFLEQVPQELFYNDAGNPNYNKIFASLARAEGVTGPEALEDGTLPNISTFQRSVAKERARREQEVAAVLASVLGATGNIGPQGQRVLDLAARMAGLG